ncbi:hypothetical protein B0J12DRAFT_675622 [Macrophomina phaseolina]|uniref:Zinc finger CCCH-type protein n=1 Tax=Macrophomina phaseolina TaxID=35725 RepID=A0ABQ8G1G0_9PEZI|nr:hypothetical protein B0J12DRAFT_675622 [Macrophomina phaseolina]
MLITDDDALQLKRWIVKRLEDMSSDADSDVLADYVLALVRAEDPDEQVKSNCLENLEDFLHDDTAPFVDDVLNIIRTKSYLPNPPASAPEQLNAEAVPFNPPSGPANNNRRSSAQFENGYHNGSADQSRKRTWGDRAGSEQRDGPDTHYGRGASGERAIKQMRRGNHQGGGGRGGRHGDMNIPGLPGLGQASMQPMPNMAQMPNLPHGFPQVDPNNPLSALMAMQAMGFPPLPGMPQMPMGGPNNFGQGASPHGFPHAGSPPPRRIGERCRDYDTKGFCALGSVCPYEHGTDPIIVPTDEYDPKNAAIDTDRHMNGHGERRHYHHHERGRGGRGRGRGDGGIRRGGRAHFSQAGPNHDRSITTIVVENIPEEKVSEDAVREFFAEFGNIEEVTLKPHKRLALVKYDDYTAARKAYDSPKVIFENRFVKVYWYKPEHHADAGGHNGRQGSEGVKKEDEEMIDMEEIKRRQEEAQKAHEEKQKKLQEAEAKKAELDAKLKAQAEERRKLLEKLAEKTAKKGAVGAPSSPTIKGGDEADKMQEDASSNGTEDKKSSQTEALKLKLAQLEAEAESMGINPNDPNYNPSSYRGRGGRGAFRGRGSWAPRGRGGYDPSYRGGYRGRGGFAGPRGGAVKRLDFRPKRVVVKIADGEEEWTSERDEALRSHLFNNFEFDSIDTYPEGGKNAMVIAFKERYIAENFISQSQEIPTIGKVQLSWAPNPPTANSASKPASAINSAAGSPSATGGGIDADTVMGGASNADVGAGATSVGAGAAGGGGGEEFDVADDEDRWMAA